MVYVLIIAAVGIASVASLMVRRWVRADMQAVRAAVRHDQVVLTRFLRDEIRKLKQL